MELWLQATASMKGEGYDKRLVRTVKGIIVGAESCVQNLKTSHDLI